MTSKTTSTSPTPSKGLGVQVQERLCTEAEHDVAVVGPSGADHPGTHLAGELDGDRSHTAGSAVDQHGLAGGEAGVDEQSLPRGQPRDRQRRGHGVVDVGGERGEVAGLDGGVFGQRAVAGPVGEAEHPLTDGEAGGAVAQLDDDSGQFVPGNAGRAVTAGPVGPGGGPLEFAGGEAGGVDAHDDVVLGGVGIGQVGQGEPTDTGVAVSYGDGLHVGSFHAVSRTLSGVLGRAERVGRSCLRATATGLAATGRAGRRDAGRRGARRSTTAPR